MCDSYPSNGEEKAEVESEEVFLLSQGSYQESGTKEGDLWIFLLSGGVKRERTVLDEDRGISMIPTVIYLAEVIVWSERFAE